jgi:DNA-binding transcriptional ArsR family regulator
MGTTKTANYSPIDLRVAAYAKALAHPARVAILNLLIRKGVCMCGDIVDELPLAQSTVSQHLRELKDAGLIQGNIDGPSVCYCVNDAALAEMVSLFSDVASEAKSASCAC